jgi:hypothetical protein
MVKMIRPIFAETLKIQDSVCSAAMRYVEQHLGSQLFRSMHSIDTMHVLKNQIKRDIFKRMKTININ